MNKLVIRPEDVDAYSPANHTGTSNQRLISRATVGARRVEALIGTIVKGHGAHAHAHPELEQASLILEGEGTGELNGEEIPLKGGDLIFNPAGNFHKFVTQSERPVRVLVVYAPPYAENPNAAILFDEENRAAGKIIGEGSLVLRPQRDTPFTPEHHDSATQCWPIVSKTLAGSEHLDIFMQNTSPSSGAAIHATPGTERIFVLEQGQITGRVNGEDFTAQAGDWLFVPDNADFEYRVSSEQPMNAFVVHAR